MLKNDQKEQNHSKSCSFMLRVMRGCYSRQEHTEVGDHTSHFCEKKRHWVIHFV